MSKRLAWWLPTALCTAVLIFGQASVAHAKSPAFPVPEPAELIALVGMGGAILVGVVWRRLRRR
jgi:hypothetical protein